MADQQGDFEVTIQGIYSEGEQLEKHHKTESKTNCREYREEECAEADRNSVRG